MLAAYLGVSILQGLWDGLPGLLAPFVMGGVDLRIVQLVIGLIGLVALCQLWREAWRREMVICEFTGATAERSFE